MRIGPRLSLLKFQVKSSHLFQDNQFFHFQHHDPGIFKKCVSETLKIRSFNKNCTDVLAILNYVGQDNKMKTLFFSQKDLVEF